jgi:hypothetical protein
MKKQEAPQEAIQKKNQTTGYMATMRGRGISKFHVHHNAKCVVCGALNPEMVRVGCIIFCKPCVEVTFKTDDPVMFEREIYLKWLHKYHEPV